MKLSALAKGVEAVIVSIEDEDLSVKLYEMGCLPGEKVKVENIAPFGDPIAITVSGYKLCVRQQEADKVFIKLDDTSEGN